MMVCLELGCKQTVMAVVEIWKASFFFFFSVNLQIKAIRIASLHLKQQCFIPQDYYTFIICPSDNSVNDLMKQHVDLLLLQDAGLLHQHVKNIIIILPSKFHSRQKKTDDES